MQTEEYKSLEENLAILLEKSRTASSLSIKEILEVISQKGRLLILILLSLPFCQPILLPGLSIPFGIAVAIIGLRIAFGKHVWLPKKILVRTIKTTTIEKIVQKALLMMKKIRPWIHPRLQWLCLHRTMQLVNGLLLFLLGVLLALPLPIPFTNITTGWSILLIGLGLLEDDGVLILIGYLITLATLALFIFLFFSVKKFF